MTITLMRNNSEKNSVTKSTTTLSTLTGTLKSATSIINPVVTIEGELSTLSRANYMYIPEFGRYYFITDIVSISNTLVEITGHVDVLSSFASQIKANTGLIDRQENLVSNNLQDGMLPLSSDTIVNEYYASGDGFNPNTGYIGLLVSCNTKIE